MKQDGLAKKSEGLQKEVSDFSDRGGKSVSSRGRSEGRVGWGIRGGNCVEKKGI